MKIAVWYNLHSGGAKRALYYHVQGLVERGHEVEVWCPPTADRDYLPLRDLACEHVVSSPQRRSTSRRIVNRVLKTYSQLQRMDAHCCECARSINAGGFDILFANSCMVSAASAIGRYVNLPRVLYLQEPARTLYEALPTLPWAALPSSNGSRRPFHAMNRSLRDFVGVQQLRIMAREERANAGAFDRILVNSYFSRESVLRAYGLDSQVCYLGINADLFAQSNVPRENIVIGVGGIVAIKNVRFVLEAIAHIPQPRPRFVWVGNIADQSYLQSLHDLAAQSNVVFEARVGITHEELRDALSRASVMVCAPRLEPFGFTPLEANACGLPVVATAEGGLRETVQDGVNGLVVDADPKAMARAIQRLLADPVLAKRLGQNGRQIVAEKWSLSASVDRLESNLAQVRQSPRITTPV